MAEHNSRVCVVFAIQHKCNPARPRVSKQFVTTVLAGEKPAGARTLRYVGPHRIVAELRCCAHALHGRGLGAGWRHNALRRDD